MINAHPNNCIYSIPLRGCRRRTRLETGTSGVIFPTPVWKQSRVILDTTICVSSARASSLRHLQGWNRRRSPLLTLTLTSTNQLLIAFSSSGRGSPLVVSSSSMTMAFRHVLALGPQLMSFSYEKHACRFVFRRDKRSEERRVGKECRSR